MNKKILWLAVLAIFFSSQASAWLFPTYDYRFPLTFTNTTDKNFTNYVGYFDLNSMPALFFSNVDANYNCLRISDSLDASELYYAALDKNQLASKGNFVVKLPSGAGINPGSSYTAYVYFDANTSAACGINNSEENAFNWSDSFSASLSDYNNFSYTINPGTGTLTVGGGNLQFSGDGAYQGILAKARQLQINHFTNKYRMRFYKTSESGPASELINNTVFYTKDQNLFAETGIVAYVGTLIKEWRIGSANGLYLFDGSTNTNKIVDYVSLRHDDPVGSAITFNTDYYRYVFYDDSNAGTKGAITSIDGNSTIQFVDENGLAPITPTVSFNGVPQTISGTGTVSFSLSSITFPLTITASLTDYGTRSYYFDTNTAFLSFSSFGMRRASQSKDIEFTFYAPDEETVLANRFVDFYYAGVLSVRGLTDSLGKITFSLAPQDSGYTTRIYSAGSDTNSQYNYTTVSVSVNRPIDESTNVSIPGSFNFDVGGLGLQNYSNQSSFPLSTIVILGNTSDVYTLRVVDSNATGQQYYARNYIMSALGDVSSITIQPYLISLVDGVLVNLRVIDRPSNINLPNIRTTLRIGIGGSKVVIEDNLTDATGVSQVVLLSQKQYELTITSANADTNFYSGNITASSASQSFYIDYSTTQSGYTPKIISISFTPKTNTLSGTTASIDFNIFVSYYYDSIYLETYDNNRLVSHNETVLDNPWQISITPTLADYNSHILVVKVFVNEDGQTTEWTKSFFITSNNNGGITNLGSLRNKFEPISLLIIMIVSITLFVGYLGIGKFGNFEQQAFIGAILLGIVAYIFFWDYLKYVIAALFVAAIAWAWGRVNR